MPLCGSSTLFLPSTQKGDPMHTIEVGEAQAHSPS